MNNESVISLKNINKYYSLPYGEKLHALKNFSLEIKKGEFVAIQGKSGAGKSTLLHILELIEEYNDGTFMFFGKNVRTMSDKESSQIRNKQIGIVLQSYGLANEYTVNQNIMFPLYFGKSIKKYEKERMVKEALEKVGILDLGTCQANKISGGQQQRVAIARAIVNNPEILYLDEPTGALDKITAHEILKFLKELNESGVTIVMVTHDEEFAKCAKRIIKIEDGCLVSDEMIENLEVEQK
ncbi:MAG: ABC transporter ATP-binding protein [Clostridia bacterium]|nr:ABC transporter ATP-binding protein [Clostridia bacterium]